MDTTDQAPTSLEDRFNYTHKLLNVLGQFMAYSDEPCERDEAHSVFVTALSSVRAFNRMREHYERGEHKSFSLHNVADTVALSGDNLYEVLRANGLLVGEEAQVWRFANHS